MSTDAVVLDERLGAVVRAMVRQEVAAILEAQVVGLRNVVTEAEDPSAADGEPIGSQAPGVSPYDRGACAEHVLREAGGGPLHVRVIAERMYSLGYKHRRVPKDKHQLESSLNSLASPSQHPDRFERVGPRMLRLRY
jgi:hypothetical protein